MKKVHSEMNGLNVISPTDCDNAPKKKILKDLLISFALNDFPNIETHITDDIEWNLVNVQTLQGKEQLMELLKKMNMKIIELEIQYLITHGKTASANGTVKFEDGRVVSFCNVYLFVSAGKNTIKEITSYIINMD